MIKTLKISEELHTKLKTYCAKHKLKLNEWVDELLDLNLTIPTLSEHLTATKDITYLNKQLASATDPADILKRKRQISLMIDAQIIAGECYIEKLKRWQEVQNNK